MKKFNLLALALLLVFSFAVNAQDDFSVDSEFSDTTPIPEIVTPDSGGLTPEAPQGFVKPPGPKKGGSVIVPHPGAAKGLIRINKDGSYQYKTREISKNKAGSFRVANMSPPKITGPGGVGYGDMYGTANLTGFLADYEWQPFQGFGALGLQAGAGFMLTRGNGRFADLGVANEVYDLFIIPMSAFVVYRFEYMRRQWVVPYVNGGGTVYGLIEKRDDSKPAKFALAPAAGFGGGLHFSVSRWDHQGAFTMQREYGVADLWITAELRIVQGIRENIDFTNRTASLGITVDY